MRARFTGTYTAAYSETGEIEIAPKLTVTAECSEWIECMAYGDGRDLQVFPVEEVDVNSF